MNIILYNNHLKCLSFVSCLGGKLQPFYFTIDPMSIIPGRKDLWN